MIKYLSEIPNKAPFVYLASRKEVFYLCGSRRMAQRYAACDPVDALTLPPIIVSDTTDYDFYVTYSESLMNSLLNNCNFERSSNYEYFDDEAVEVLYSEDVQVVMRKSAEFYGAVYESISLDFYYHYLWKSAPMRTAEDVIDLGINKQIRDTMNQLFRTARAGKGE